MSFEPGQFKEAIVDVLRDFDVYSEAAVNLLFGTAATESHLGKYIRQIKGPALGVFQMEPNTEKDIWENYIKYKGDLKAKLKKFGYVGPDNSKLKLDLRYQIIMARIHYLRVPTRLPSDLEGQANYWKKHYNTYLGAGTPEKYIKSYKDFR